MYRAVIPRLKLVHVVPGEDHLPGWSTFQSRDVGSAYQIAPARRFDRGLYLGAPFLERVRIEHFQFGHIVDRRLGLRLDAVDETGCTDRGDGCSSRAWRAFMISLCSLKGLCAAATVGAQLKQKPIAPGAWAHIGSCYHNKAYLAFWRGEAHRFRRSGWKIRCVVYTAFLSSMGGVRRRIFASCDAIAASCKHVRRG